MHAQSWFLTLTYRDDALPDGWNLQPRDFTLFMKRVRKKFGPVRYFMCGEYGDVAGKPHYHACVFGLNLSDLEYYKGEGDNKLYNSPSLQALWPFGYVVIGLVTVESANYVAQYVVKKVTGKRAAAQASERDPAFTREWVEAFKTPPPTESRFPQYGRMSRRPGIGESFLRKYLDDVYNYDRVVLQGKEFRPPRYYDKKLAEWNMPRLYQHKVTRVESAEASSEARHPDRLLAREKITAAKLSLKKRSL